MVFYFFIHFIFCGLTHVRPTAQPTHGWTLAKFQTVKKQPYATSFSAMYTIHQMSSPTMREFQGGVFTKYRLSVGSGITRVYECATDRPSDGLLHTIGNSQKDRRNQRTPSSAEHQIYYKVLYANSEGVRRRDILLQLAPYRTL